MIRDNVIFDAFLSKNTSGDFACRVSTSMGSADYCSFTFTDEENASGFFNSKAQRERFAEYHDFPISHSSKQDAESGYHYFGARYYDSELLMGWLSVDPMSDKYPTLSPYAYCAWNPVTVVDPNGMDTLHLFATNLLDQDQNENNLSILRWMRADGDVAGMVTLSMHGTSQSVVLPLHDGEIEISCDASDYATFIKNQSLPDYEENKRNGKNTIFLLYSCNTGEGCCSFAEKLSNSLGEITIAPEGRIVIGDKRHSMRNCVSKSDDMTKSWNVFFKGRKVTSFSDILPKEWINSMGGVDNAVEKIIELDRKKHPWE